MFIRVDNQIKGRMEGFSYINEDGVEETVGIANHIGVVKIDLSGSEEAYMYKSDIPNLIKALQASYDYVGE